MKTNLIIDGNYVLYRNVHSLMSTRTLYGDLENALNVSLTKMIGKYPYNKICLVSDSQSSSWRKQFHNEYKATRVRDNAIDWEFVFEVYAYVKESVKTLPRLTVYEDEGVEGDDWITHLVKKHNSEGVSNIIVASDGDLHQLLDYRMTPEWINIQWRDTFRGEKIFLPSGYRLLLDHLKNTDDDIFSLNNNGTFLSMVNNWISTIDHEEVDIEKKLFVKLVHGDSGDNIKSVFSKETKSGKMQGIGEAGAKKIYQQYKEVYPGEIDFFDSDWMMRVVPFILENKKIAHTPADERQIIANLKFNRRLIHLDERYLPLDIKGKINRV
jgi:5'-3' exonuclease